MNYTWSFSSIFRLHIGLEIISAHAGAQLMFLTMVHFYMPIVNSIFRSMKSSSIFDIPSRPMKSKQRRTDVGARS